MLEPDLEHILTTSNVKYYLSSSSSRQIYSKFNIRKLPSHSKLYAIETLPKTQFGYCYEP